MPYDEKYSPVSVEFNPKEMKGIVIPRSAGNAIDVYCVIEKMERFKYGYVTLMSERYNFAHFDFSRVGLNEAKLLDILKCVNYYTTIVKGAIKPKHYLSYSNTLYKEGDSKEIEIDSDNLIDIRVPKPCKRFSTYGRLISEYKVNGTPVMLRSKPVNVQNYWVQRVVSKERTLNKDLDFVRFEDGQCALVSHDEGIISPNNINKDGVLTIDGLLKQ